MRNKVQSLVERVASLFRKRKARHQVAARKTTSPVKRFQRHLRMKRLIRTINFYLAVIFLVAFVGWLSVELLPKSDIFRVADVEVVGNKIVTEHEVLDKAGLRGGINMLDIDCRRVEENIERLPWVEDVKIKRQWPSTVHIEVQEHKPLALVNIPQNGQARLYYLDTNGHVFVQTESGNDLDFPVLNGQDLAEDIRTMRLVEGSMTDMAFRFLKLAASGNQILPLQAISEVRVSKREGLIVYLVDHPFPIYLGQEKIRERYYLLVRLLGQLYAKDTIGEIKEIRMNYAENKIMVASLGKS